jgi:hypothetical protein
MLAAMSETEISAGRDQRSGRFLPGNTGFNGRPKGSRNKLGEAFLEDLRESWNEVGAIALKRAAEEDPVGYCKIIASLMPRDLNLNIAVDPTAFIETFRSARSLLGNPEPPRLRRSLRKQPPVIEHDD